MDKSCANHPESMALATCKACDKSICLMCVVDEKEGTFCSSECHAAFVEGREVPRYEESAAQPASVASSGVQKIESIFDDGPSPAPAASEGVNLPPSDDPMPIVAEGTKWRSIGAQCENHSDTPAVANCDRCAKPVCALCLLEASQGTFCSSDCMSSVAEQAPAPAPAGRRGAPAPQPVLAPAERAALQGRPVFKFKEPPKSNKTGLLAVVAVFAVIVAVGGYYAWKAFSPEGAPGLSKPPVVENTPPVNPDPVDVKPPTPDPVAVKPPPVTPDPAPEVKAPDPEPRSTGVYLTPRVVPKPVPTRTLNPWAEEQPGCWFRLRTTAGSRATYTDIGLKEKSASSYTLSILTSADGKVNEKKVDAPVVYLRGEQTITLDGQSYLCEAQAATPDPKAPKTLSLLSSKYPGAVFQSEAPEAPFTATKAWEYSLVVKGRSFDCLVVEGLSDKKPVKTYYCAIPIQMVRLEKVGESTVLVDFGTDWAKRPAFPN